MKFISRGILLDILILCIVLIKQFIGELSSLIILTILLIVYGFLGITSYVFKPENKDGESKVGYLLFGILYIIAGLALLVFIDLSHKYIAYIFCSIIFIHGLFKLFIKANKGIAIKIIQIIWGLLLIVYALYAIRIIPNITFITNIFNSNITLLAMVVIDFIVLILYRVLPRKDLENKNVKIDYSSDEDQIVIKKDHSYHEVEVIDLNKLFKKTEGDNNEEV